jgi:hypothetical protein
VICFGLLVGRCPVISCVPAFTSHTSTILCSTSIGRCRNPLQISSLSSSLKKKYMRHNTVHAPIYLIRAHARGGDENLDGHAAEMPSSDTVYSRRRVAGEPGWPAKPVCHHVTMVRKTRRCRPRRRSNSRQQEIQSSRADELWRFHTKSTLLWNIHRALLLNIRRFLLNR